MKPQLAKDAIEDKIQYPCIVQPKIDGVRGLNIGGELRARSLKHHGNHHVREMFSKMEYLGLDGELYAGPDPYAQNLCRSTTSATSSHSGAPDVRWMVFDLYNAETAGMPYKERFRRLGDAVYKAPLSHRNNIGIIPSRLIHNHDELLELENDWVGVGAEGIIVRNPNSLYKQGRSTKEGQLWRIKRFVEALAEVVGIAEGNANGNEATENELGRTARSSHQENMTPNGLVGSFQCRMLEDVDFQGKRILSIGQEITVSPGEMTHAEREHYFKNQHLIVHKAIKFKFFPHGMKDKPRFPTFVCVPNPNDTSS